VEIQKQLNIDLLNKYYEDGWLVKRNHPTLPLIVWNYSPKTQYESRWDRVTLMCRGLVTDFQGNIVARTWGKFFNMEEGKHTPTQDFEVFEKMDGSCIILFYYNDEWIFATRGSFESEQAIKAKELSSKYPLENLDKKKTYIFEIIY
jgi:tRNA splicing ligase